MSDNMDAPPCPAHDTRYCRTCMDALARYEKAGGGYGDGELLMGRYHGKTELGLAWKECYDLGLFS